jgi:hypothetical protein
VGALAVDPLASFARAQKAHEHLSLLDTIHGREAFGRWVAISLDTGACDMRLYDSKAEAIRFQLHETQCAYLYMNGVPRLGEVRLFLDTNEELYDAGLRLDDPATYVNPEFML